VRVIGWPITQYRLHRLMGADPNFRDRERDLRREKKRENG